MKKKKTTTTIQKFNFAFEQAFREFLKMEEERLLLQRNKRKMKKIQDNIEDILK